MPLPSRTDAMPKSDADRLAAALRANLKRRKAQARARQADDPEANKAEGGNAEGETVAGGQAVAAMQPGSTAGESAVTETNGRDQD